MKIRIHNHGTIFLAQPLDAAAGEWIDDTAPTDAQFFGGMLVIEHRFVANFVEVARDAGADVS